jgi:hypothetical protein
VFVEVGVIVSVLVEVCVGEGMFVLVEVNVGV